VNRSPDEHFFRIQVGIVVWLLLLLLLVMVMMMMIDRDVLLLEAGFVTILVAPLNFFGLHDAVWHHCHDNIAMLLVRWLLFRLTFASGVAKLTSSSESWWKLTGQSLTAHSSVAFGQLELYLLSCVY